DLGAINLAYQGGTGTVTFSWEGPSGFTATTEDITDLDPGSYTVTATDNSGCVFDTTFKVLDEYEFYAYISEQKDACLGTSNGKATVSYFSPEGNTNITYQWDAAAGDQTTAEATNLDAGTYSVTVTDTDLGVDDIVSVTIEELSYTFDGEIDPSSTTVLDCSGDTDGYIDVTITPPGGETPYTYAWNTGAATQDLINIGTGTYSVTVTDANECQFTIPNYEITEPAALLTSADVLKRPTCHGDYDGELEAAASGGTGVYAYLWNDPGSQNSKIANGLDAGFYTVTVTDANGCQNSSSVNLTQPPPIEIDETVYDISCTGETDGAVQLATTGGTPAFSYFWNTNDGSGLDQTGQNQAGLTAGKYYFTATDAHNCLYEDSVKIIEPPALQIIDETVNDASSASATDGSVTVEATGGTGTLTFTLTPGSIGNETGIFGNLSPGDYTVEVTDINSCGPVTINLTVGYPNAIESVHAADNIRLYPNPTSSKITIAIDSEQAASYTFEILNISGQRLLKETTQSSGDLLKEFDLSEYAKGIYFIKVSTEDLYYQEKVIFQ
ncbi:MAG TPA: T9SS type A sorting domain-containing protein, partial [Bacteroidales bacterium]|nr:T9SS type A sorting domain-containing protein [Bacteroidales bacterium]